MHAHTQWKVMETTLQNNTHARNNNKSTLVAYPRRVTYIVIRKYVYIYIKYIMKLGYIANGPPGSRQEPATSTLSHETNPEQAHTKETTVNQRW